MTSSTQTNLNKLLQVQDLKVHFPLRSGLLGRVSGYVKAVDGISFNLYEGETLGLVGESGCGKTTVGRSLLKLVHPTSGTVKFASRDFGEVDIVTAKKDVLSKLRQDMQIVFQDPFASLNPRMNIYNIVGDPLRVNGLASGSEKERRVGEMLQKVGLSPDLMPRYPHAFSGGQRQRIGIARSLIMNPTMLIADEPVSALDVSVQAQILNLMQDLQNELNLTILFISHDLSVIQQVSHRVAVMYVGQLVELASVDEIFSQPKHPYTQALLSSVPVPNPEVKSMGKALSGEVADPANPPSGCYFHPRCPFAKEICKTDDPPLKKISDGRFAKCHFTDEIQLEGVSASE